MPEQKLLAVVVGDAAFAGYHDLSDVPAFHLKEIEHFYDVYKDLERSQAASRGWGNAQQANQVLEEALRAAQKEGIPGSSR